MGMRAKPTKRDPKIEPPKTIQLPDGRVVILKDVVGKLKDRRSYNLRTGTEYGGTGRRKISKSLDSQTKE